MDKKIIYKENGVEKEVVIEDLKELDGVEIIDSDDDFNDNSIKGRIIGATPFICLIIYLLLGFYKDLWHPGWVVFLLIPLVPTFFSLFSKSRGSVIGFLSLLICISYVVLGFLYNFWHPGWIMFLLIPVVSILIGGSDSE